MMTTRWTAFLFRLLVALPALAAVPASAQPPLTLSQAIAETLAHNPSLRAGRAGVAEAGAHVTEAQAGWFPRISVSETWQRGNQPVFVFSSLLAARQFTAANFAIDALNRPNPVGFFRTSVGIEHTLFDGGRQKATVDRSRLDHEMAQSGFDEAAAALIAGTTESYGRVLAADAGHRAAEAALQAAREDRTRAEQRRDAGLATDGDVLAIVAHAADLEQQVIQLAGDAAIARAELNRLMGSAVDRDYQVSESTPASRMSAIDLDALLAEAEAGRPELKRAAAAQRLASAGARQARSALIPQIATQAAIDVSGTRFNDRASGWILGGEARWSLSLGGAETARVTAATHARARADAELDAARAAVHVEVVTALRRRQSAEARLAAGRAAIEQARESQRIVRDRFDAGLATVTDVLRAASAVFGAEARRTAAVVDAMISDAQLTRAIGRTP